MELQFYNSYSRKKELFQPITEDEVGLYTCGPTVYDFSHIGNFRTFMFEDLLKRWLLHLGYNVKHIMNITDLDDKTIAKARNEKVELRVVTNRYADHFMEDLKWLKILPADKYPRATDSIKKMIDIIQVLLDKGFAYRESNGSIYFNIHSFPDYGKLTNLNIEDQQKTKRIVDDEYDKGSPQDFALWKAWKEEDVDAVWDAPWGRGRPGWHIECSAMSSETLGDHFDIHCGGVDNMFPHHENELAQSICSTGKKFVNYWLHSEFLLVDGGKMSKSLGNFYTINDLKKKGFSAESIRYQLLAGHYRTKISFSFNKKQESDKLIQRITDFHSLLKKNVEDESKGNDLPDSYYEFSDAMNDDLNTPKALAVFLTWMKSEMKRLTNDEMTINEIKSAWNYLNVFNSVFSFIDEGEIILPDNVEELINLRNIARIKKDWNLSDSLRSQIKREGWLVEDAADGQKIKKI
jgi:cysteinyl-tRNA synthetase